tara:strand:+ start:38 stop:484 length:447 start_codon:yes stop_codon:yes gene_type:complete
MAIQYGDGTSSNVGRVIKVQKTIYGSNQTVSSSSWQNLGTNMAITVNPESTNSRFWLLFTGTAQVNGNRARFDIFDNVRNNHLSGRTSLSAIENGPHVNTMITMQHFDEPNSTSTRIYTPQVKQDGTHQVYINAGTNISSFVVVEFAD